jgi:hypothetical protein
MLSLAKFEAFATVSMSSSLLWDFAELQLVVLLPEFRESVSVPSRCPKTSWHWVMVPRRFLEISVTNYQLTLCNVPEERSSSVISGWKFVDAETHVVVLKMKMHGCTGRSRTLVVQSAVSRADFRDSGEYAYGHDSINVVHRV